MMDHSTFLFAQPSGESFLTPQQFGLLVKTIQWQPYSEIDFEFNFILRPTTGVDSAMPFFKVGSGAGPQPTRVR